MRIYPKEKVTTIADTKDKFLGLFEEGFTYTVWRNKNEMFVVDSRKLTLGGLQGSFPYNHMAGNIEDTAGVLPKNKAREPLSSGEEFIFRSPSSECDNAKISKEAYDRMCDTIYEAEQEDLLVGRVAGMLRDFMRECNDSNRWDARTSRAEVGGFMRSWAKKIIEEVKNDKL